MKPTIFSFALMALFCLCKVPMLIGQTDVGQRSSVEGLYDEIANMDEVLFKAFNQGDKDKIRKLFTEDLEFYHDQSGLSGYESNIAAIGRITSGENKIRRALVEGSLEVFPVPGFGAIQVGQHDFFETSPGQQERKTGTFKFVHLWKKTDDGWKLARVVSYGH